MGHPVIPHGPGAWVAVDNRGQLPGGGTGIHCPGGRAAKPGVTGDSGQNKYKKTLAIVAISHYNYK